MDVKRHIAGASQSETRLFPPLLPTRILAVDIITNISRVDVDYRDLERNGEMPLAWRVKRFSE